MWYVYVLKSEKFSDEKLYIGFTQDLKERLCRHNSGKGKYTRFGIPWRLVYYEAFRSKGDAQTRERKLKQYPSGFTQLKKRLVNSLNLNDQEVWGRKVQTP